MSPETTTAGAKRGVARAVAPGPEPGVSPSAHGARDLPDWLRRAVPMLVVGLAYLVAVSAIMIWRAVPVSPAYLLLLLVPVVLLAGRFARVMGDWAPIAAVALAYAAMAPVVHHGGVSPQVVPLVRVETWLFAGHDPSEVLQHAVGGTALHVLAVAATSVYFSFFALPVVVGLALWLRDATQYLRFVTALLGMAVVAYVTFLLVPTAPPWYAAEQHALSGVTDLIRSQHTLPAAVSPLYSRLDPNPAAAFPSLHAAFPFLGWLAMRRSYPSGSWIILGWFLLIAASVVFLGEHYVIDVVAGALLATAAWAVMTRLLVPHVDVLRGAASGPAPRAAGSARA
ncbi:MAG: phosphatase PAP2 family protein [Candidatus Dormibacteria bacterium]